MHGAGLLVIASVVVGLLVQNAKAAPSTARPPVGTFGALAALPEAPEKAIVLNYCAVCHDIDWVVRSGGTVDGWTDRLQRMIRAGATLPKEQIPAVAVYLAKAFPPRLREGEEK
jgi:cytochrome c5